MNINCWTNVGMMNRWIDGWMDGYNVLQRKSYIAQSAGTILSAQLDYYLLYRYELNFIQNTGNATVSAFLYSFSQIIIFIGNYKLEYSAYLFPNNSRNIGFSTKWNKAENWICILILTFVCVCVYIPISL